MSSALPERREPVAGTRPPFAKGNLANMRIGHRSARVYGALAEQLSAGLLEDRPDLAAYPEAVAAWATAEAQATLMRRHLGEHGPLDEGGNPRETHLKWHTQLEKAAARYREVLGLTPQSEAAVAKERAQAATSAVDLEILAERGRQALQRRERNGDPQLDLAGDVLAVQQMAYEEERIAAEADWERQASRESER